LDGVGWLHQQRRNIMSDIPDWAWERAREMGATQGLGHYTLGYVKSTGLGNALARYIAQHEDPPRDKLRWILDTAGYENGFHISQDFVDAVRTLLPAAAISAIEEMDGD
jgi:hypothetical protein